LVHSYCSSVVGGAMKSAQESSEKLEQQVHDLVNDNQHLVAIIFSAVKQYGTFGNLVLTTAVSEEIPDRVRIGTNIIPGDPPEVAVTVLHGDALDEIEQLEKENPNNVIIDPTTDRTTITH